MIDCLLLTQFTVQEVGASVPSPRRVEKEDLEVSLAINNNDLLMNSNIKYYERWKRWYLAVAWRLNAELVRIRQTKRNAHNVTKRGVTSIWILCSVYSSRNFDNA